MQKPSTYIANLHGLAYVALAEAELESPAFSYVH